jgi:cobalt-zinc-cadmium efflux system outer membrane protein
MVVAPWAAAYVLCSSVAAAEECATRVVRRNVVQCALRASPAIEVERLGVEALAGRRRAVSPLLPANPTLTLLGSSRHLTGSQTLNWSATLSQEVEVSGQRGARRDAVASALSAQEQATLATERAVAADAWHAYFEALAAQEAADAAARLEQAFAQATKAAQAGAAQGLVSGVDADVAELTLVRLSQARLEAERQRLQLSAALASSFGLDPAAALPTVDGELAPLAHLEALRSDRLDKLIDDRPEVVQAKQTERSYAYASTALRRARVPNLTVSLFAQRDGFDERVLGGGISLPIPLPEPIGRTFAGEIAENAALSRQAGAVLASVRRQARLEVVAAWQAFDAANAQRRLFSDERIARAEHSLSGIASEISAGRLSISAAIVAQQTLIEFLRAYVEAKLAVCLTSVELARAAGLALIGGDL